MGGSVGSEDGDVGFQIAPMVDVVFVLMLFFMASAGSQVMEKELSVNLPSGAPATGDATIVVPTFVDISADGQVVVNGATFDSPDDRNMPELKAWLRTNITEFGNNDPVIIRPTPDTRHERIIDVLNAAAAAEVKKLTFS